MENKIRNKIEHARSVLNGEELLEKVFLIIKDDIRYRFGNWNVPINYIEKKRVGMCTTKSKYLFFILDKLGFDAYYRILRIDARSVFKKFMLSEIEGVISKNSIHVYVVVKLKDRIIELDPSIDRALEDKLSNFGYYFPRNWSIKMDYVNFIEQEFIINKSELLKELNFNHSPNFLNYLKFYFGNQFLDYIRSCDKRDLTNKRIEKKPFLKWMIKKNFLLYLLLRIFLFIKN